jgi:uncharacterized membrane protein YfcA
MEYIGFLLGILIGISLGLIGGGGSILTIPILVYIMGISPSNSTTYSLFIVGVATLIGSIKGIKDKMLDYQIAIYFGVPSIVSIFIMRKYIMPMLPETLFSIADFSITKDLAIMLVFAILMIVASFSMIKKEIPIQVLQTKINAKEIILKGIVVGVLTGFVGVGGGFLIIPTLLFSANLPMRKAVITSLLIITFNSLIGFAGSLNSDPIDWEFLIEFTGFAVVGILIGMYFSQKISNEKLKPIFGWFILIMGIYILIKETLI